MARPPDASSATPDATRLALSGLAVVRAAPRAKWLLAGDVSALVRVVADLLGIDARPNSVVRADGVGACLAWRPDQLLLLLDEPRVASEVRATLRRLARSDVHVLDAGARYVEWAVTGAQADALLNAGCSLDLRPAAFPIDSCTGTRIEQVPVLMTRAAADGFELLVERPLAAYFWRWMCRAAESL